MESGGTARRGFRLTGRVQGVGFRWWTRRTAEELGLRGTVRNRRDGSVEIHAEGGDDAMESFARRIRSGPSAARVDEVEELEAKTSLPDGFRIVH
ncbi:MAG: acylphosphatase [Gemmatimonadetes bacterium]|nr:acylphosphatase [Gemmatimonadota bacterium]NIR77055.1 acylphosphatase [Gemmatimonadota bacterium]NIT85575.1 acylphosphatase [Gemmatimonadota bacterium]NIU29407.1 acylphosphatase [Gemmatimonadota bacterium]NIU34472.1 acylphosphatase [Gemmatimonadota bacterium]